MSLISKLSDNAAARTMHRRTETSAMHWQLLCAFLDRASSIIRDGRAVRVQFAAEIDAEQFAKFINSGKGRAHDAG